MIGPRPDRLGSTLILLHLVAASQASPAQDVTEKRVIREKPATTSKKGEDPNALVKANANARLLAERRATIERNITEKLRSIHRAELRLLTSAASPSSDQRREIALDVSQVIAILAPDLARNYQSATIDPQQALRTSVVAAARKTLKPEQFARYQQEVEARTLESKQAMIACVVANMDELLSLGVDQRKQIGEALVAHYEEMYWPARENLPTYDGYFPRFPDSYIERFLTEAQRDQWKMAPRMNFGTVRNNNYSHWAAGDANLPEDKVEDPDEKAAFDRVKGEKK